MAPLLPGDLAKDAYFEVGTLKTGLGAQTGRSARTVLLFSVLRLMFTISTTAVLARLLGPEVQGLVAMILPIIVIASGVAEFGLPQAVIQRDSISHRQVSALFWINAALGVFLTGAVIAAAPAVARFYETPGLAALMVGAAPYILMTVLAVPYVAILRRRMEIRTAERCSFIGIVAGSAMAIGAALAGAGPWALVVQMVGARAATVLAFLWVVKWRPTVPWGADYRAARSALAFGGKLSADRLLLETVGQLPTIVIGRLFGETSAGLFYRSLAFAQMPRRRIVSPLSGAFVPSLSRLQDDPAGMRAMFVRQVTRSNLILVPVGLTILVAPDAMVLTLLGPDWTAAIPMMRWLGVLPLIAVIGDACNWVLVALGESGKLLRVRVGAAVIVLGALAVGSQFDVITLVGCVIGAQAVVACLYTPFLITRLTPITVATLKEALMGDLLFIVGAGLAALLLRTMLDLAPIWEGVIAGAAICLMQALRVALSPRLRADMLKAIRR